MILLLCLQKLESGVNHGVAHPASIKPYIFTTLAWGNIDGLEETPTGKGTYHRVNGIEVQAKIYGPHLPTHTCPCMERKSYGRLEVNIKIWKSTYKAPLWALTSSNMANPCPGSEKAAKFAREKNLMLILKKLW